jgi:hypothetical protein
MAKFLSRALEKEYAVLTSDTFPNTHLSTGLLKLHLPGDIKQLAAEYTDVAKLLG